MEFTESETRLASDFPKIPKALYTFLPLDLFAWAMTEYLPLILLTFLPLAREYTFAPAIGWDSFFFVFTFKKDITFPTFFETDRLRLRRLEYLAIYFVL